MTKAQLIRDGLAEGLSNEQILAASITAGMPTTMNSIRWYRSKESKPVTSKKKVWRPTSRKSVSDVVKERDLTGRIIGGLECLCPDKIASVVKELDTWTFRVNGRANSRSGQCRYGRREIEVHEVLMSEHNSDNLDHTLLHEIAHAVNKMINGYNDSHGPNWQRIMVAFGCEPRRTTCASVSSELRTRKTATMRVVETWECTRCGHEHPIARRRKYPAGMYKHSRCGGKFKVKGE